MRNMKRECLMMKGRYWERTTQQERGEGEEEEEDEEAENGR